MAASPKTMNRKRAAVDQNKDSKPATKRVRICNSRPSERIDVLVCGSGDFGELGLGASVRHGLKPAPAKRPRRNDLLDRTEVGVVQVAAGGMHAAALTYNGKILTWGVNDDGALGRDTSNTDALANAPNLSNGTKQTTKGDITGLADTNGVESSDKSSTEDDDDDSIDLNAIEATPLQVGPWPASLGHCDLVQVVATDSATFALTADGRVYGWGTFKGAEGTFGFSPDSIRKGSHSGIQTLPALIPDISDIVMLAANGNHVLAIDAEKHLWTWGWGGQSQLGRRTPVRRPNDMLRPRRFMRPKDIVQVACGLFHSFALDERGRVYAWGLNNYGQTGIATGTGEPDAVINTPTLVKSLAQYKIRAIAGGSHHSMACTEDGIVLVWGRCDEDQMGLALDQIPRENLVSDDRGRPRILLLPAKVPDLRVAAVAAGIDNSIAILQSGQAVAWGYSDGYRTGLGTEDSVARPKTIESTDTRAETFLSAACGGQFSLLTGRPRREMQTV